MKSLFKIMRNYIGTALIITLSILILNFAILAGIVLYYGSQEQNKSQISKVAEELRKTEEGFVLSESGKESLADYEWAFLLDDEGNVIWDYDMPQDFAMKYSASEIAAFSKWYLHDYPVKCWKHTNGLLVLGEEKDSVWKQEMEFGMPLVTGTGSILKLVLAANGTLILLFCVGFGLHFYHSLKPLAAGIENLAKEESISLAEKGMTAELAAKLNQTSRILEQQKKVIAARDTARTNWIAGVSHDIRTPLSMIMGYSEQLGAAENLQAEQKKQVNIITSQSIKIKNLIEDLNLTSKLQYQMQPLRKEVFQPAKLMRQIVVSYYNNGLDERYEINLDVAEEVEALNLTGDTQLLTRAFENLIGNSLRHNESGCAVDITMKEAFGNRTKETESSRREKQGENMSPAWLEIHMKDNGCGIPPEIMECLQEENELEGDSGQQEMSRPHIMGLYVVKQIVASHGGTLEFPDIEQGTNIKILFPCN